MAKQNKKDINNNFEALKAQMMKKRLMAEEVMEEESNIGELKNDKREFESNNSNQVQMNSTDIEDRGFLHVEVEQQEPQVSMAKVIIKKVEKPQQPKRITYYLKPDTIKKIEKYSNMAGMGKSEFVQNILDTVLNNLEIE